MHNLVNVEKIFMFDTFIERVEVRDMSDLAIYFGNYEAQSPLRATVLLKNSSINHVLEFLFECLLIGIR